MLEAHVEQQAADWLAGQILELTDTIESMTPSEYSEKVRYLPSSVTPFPGFMDFGINPYMREIADCFDIHSSVREVNLLKGVQITYTTVLETIMLYYMALIKTAPLMYVTADSELARARVENNIIPMINQSGLADIIQSSDENNPRKTGKTDRHIQWVGGGYMVPQGANNANKMRSYSIMVMLKDELDGWPTRVGKDGDPDRLTDDRCAAYWHRRKIFRGSTPLVTPSPINTNYLRGDQRRYNVRCLKCEFPQPLHWRGVNEQTGHEYGMMWETDGGMLVPDSVGWACKNCGHLHHEHDKIKLFDDRNNGAHWVPTAKPVEPGIRSYYLPALYSPVGMQPWSKCIQSWVDAWDDENHAARDLEKLQVFYNNVLAQPFEIRGDGVKLQAVSSHRRQEYGMGSAPSQYAADVSGQPISLAVCTVDVHGNNLAVAVHGIAQGDRYFLIDYWRFEGDTSDLNAECWAKMREVIETREYSSDDGRTFPIAITLVDASWNNDLVVRFCGEYAAGVFPILGRDRPSKNQRISEFAEFKTQHGTLGFRITVDLYKDRWAPRLNKMWSGTGQMPEGTYNAPTDVTDKQLKELTVEYKREKKDAQTGQRLGVVWHRPGNVPNELWDLLIYAAAAVDILAWDVCRNQMQLDFVNWPAFWDEIESGKMFYRTG